MPSISKSIQLARNMGLRYISYRLQIALEKKLGVFAKKFPQNPAKEHFISLQAWRKQTRFFGVTAAESSVNKTSKTPELENLLNGKILFFSSQWMDLGKDYDWVTNPDSNHRYDPNQHWSQVQDFNPKAGDIKFVWEKSRFSYLYDVIRYDHVKKEDHSEWVFKEIRSWLSANKINSGPNYICSQETSLRILNWTYAMHYYKESEHLTEELFQEIIHSIYWQIKHVYANINFSRIAVRNNHAITETLTLYISSWVYPFFPEAEKWKKNGKKWFEEEIAYQVYPDGTFLQFSMNYHRVLIQLFCWAFKSSDFFGEKFDDIVYERAYRSLKFLYSCQVESGWLPNYGNNDGALFFKFNGCDFRDYRPQLNALHVLLSGKPLYGKGDWEEDVFWLKAQKIKACNYSPLHYKQGWSEFEDGGYFVLREENTLTFIRCGKHKDRPGQADNLHMDIWYKGENILFDGGTYKYNTDPGIVKYFMGTASHNSVMLGTHDQMEKGPRFIWFNWTQSFKAKVYEKDGIYGFVGEISAFRHLDPRITHLRKMRKTKGQEQWEIEDFISKKPKDIKMRQYWHSIEDLLINSKDSEHNIVPILKEKGMKSDYYGLKEDADQYITEVETDYICTTISIK
jgi:hypothetical protein